MLHASLGKKCQIQTKDMKEAKPFGLRHFALSGLANDLSLSHGFAGCFTFPNRLLQ